jgi:uncharacterized protein
LSALEPAALAGELGVGEHTLRDILANLARPGRDPREDLPPPVFKRGILKLEDLTVGMELSGAVLNVVDFGAFVDIGLTDSGLVHISELADKFVSNPHEIVAVGDIVNVWVLSVDKDRRRVSLTMISPEVKKEAEARAARREQELARIKSERAAAAAAARAQSRPAGANRSGDALPPRGGHASRPHTRTQHVQAGARQQVAAAATARPPRKSRPPVEVKLTKKEVEGKEPVRSFAALKVLLELKSQDPPEKPS